jgi:hypothetical protein
VPWALLTAGAVIAAAATMTWATASLSVFSVSTTGTEADGRITVVLGIVVAVAGLLAAVTTRPRPWAIVAVVAGATTAGVAALDAIDVRRAVVGATPEMSISVGVGLWLTIAAAVVATVLAAQILRTTPVPSHGPAPSTMGAVSSH